MAHQPVCSRRDFLKLATAGVLGGTAGSPAAALADELVRTGTGGKTPSCLLIWMPGGVNQGFTWDPKEQYNHCRRIDTSVPGIGISEFMPNVARQMHHLALLRGMDTREANHRPAIDLMSTGFRRFSPTLTYPSLGCLAAAEIGDSQNELPNFVVIGAMGRGDDPGDYRNQLTLPGFLGSKHAPFVLHDATREPDNFRPGSSLQTLKSRMALLEEDERQFQQARGTVAAEAHWSAHQRALRLLDSVKARAFSIDQEPLPVRESYGEHRFGKACLLARRLLEHGVPIVQVDLGGWDDHTEQTKPRVLAADSALGALLLDLHQRSLLATTLVVIWSEMGRHPKSRGNHYGTAWTTVLAGAGIKAGIAVGRTNDDGLEVKDRPVTAPEFFATIHRALRIDAAPRSAVVNGRAVEILDRGAKPIDEVLA